MTDARSIQNRRMSFAAGISIVAGALIIFSSLIVWPQYATSIVGSRGIWWRMDDFMEEGESGVEGGGVNGMIMAAPNAAAVTGLASGVLVLLGGIMMYFRPQNKRIWGIIALIFSVMALLSLGGFLIGAGLGVIGGILAIANRQVR